MKFDKTCCGTTCDAKANANYVAALERLITQLMTSPPNCWAVLYRDNEELIKHAQQNNSTTE